MKINIIDGRLRPIRDVGHGVVFEHKDVFYIMVNARNHHLNTLEYKYAVELALGCLIAFIPDDLVRPLTASLEVTR